MVEEKQNEASNRDWLVQAQDLVPLAVEKAKEVKVFLTRWKRIISKLEQIPSCLSDLSSHPCFSKSFLCKEQLQAVWKTLNESIELAESCVKEEYDGKLRMQSDLDSLYGKFNLNLKDCGLLVKTGVLGDSTLPQSEPGTTTDIRELLARLQIGHLESKHKALDDVMEFMREDEKGVLSLMKRNDFSALIQLLTATSPRIQEKAVTVICSVAESGCFESYLVSQGVLPPLIRLIESGSSTSKENATISLQRLSVSLETARAIVGHNGVRPLIEICQNGDSITQAAAACTLKNLSASPELRQTLADEGIIRVMINLLDSGILLGSKQYAADCLQNLTASNENLRKLVISENGIVSILAYLDSPLPQESAVVALKNLVGSVSVESLILLNVLPRLVRILKSGGAQVAAMAAICRISSSVEMKKLIGESDCILLLVKLLQAKSNSTRELAAQAISSLISLPLNCAKIKRDDTSVPNLVQLLDPSPSNTAKKYAISCLLVLSSSKKCKKLMVSYGAIGYLKKLSDMDIPGAEKLLERMDRRNLLSLFSLK